MELQRKKKRANRPQDLTTKFALRTGDAPLYRCDDEGYWTRQRCAPRAEKNESGRSLVASRFRPPSVSGTRKAAAARDSASEVESGKSLNVLFAALANMLKPLNQQQTRKSVRFRFLERSHTYSLKIMTMWRRCVSKLKRSEDLELQKHQKKVTLSENLTFITWKRFFFGVLEIQTKIRGEKSLRLIDFLNFFFPLSQITDQV